MNSPEPQPTEPSVENASAGIVFAATGERYTTLARRAVRTLRRAMPDAAVDLFTDQPIADDAFDRVHPTSDDWFRPKIEALRRSRFERTLYLDADILVIADISDVFEVLRRFDLVATHGRYSNGDLSRRIHTHPIVPAFPQINGGVLGIRKSPGTTALLEGWEEALRSTGSDRDQPALRELVWNSDLRPYVLPRQYNFNGYDEIRGWDIRYAAPRVIHAPILHRAYAGKPFDEPIALSEVMNRRQEAKLRVLVDADRSLQDAKAAPRLPAGRAARKAWRLLARLA